MSKPLNVVALVLENHQGEILVAKRAEHKHLGGMWEFPGGKVERDETVAQALARELKEEVGIEVLTCQPLINIKHDYRDKKVYLEVFIVDNYLGEPSAQEGQKQGWFLLTEFKTLDFPKANEAIIEKLITSHS